MLKIVFIVESLDVGGTELSLLKWLRHCDRTQFDPSVVSFRKGDLMKELEGLSIHALVIHKKFPFDVSFLYRLTTKLKKIGPDIIHCRNGIPAISYGVLAAKMLNIPVISSVHGRTHYIRQDFKTWLWFRIMRLSQRIITVTNGIKDEIAELGGVDRQWIQVLHNGIDINNHTYDSPKGVLRQKFGLDVQDFVIGSVGNLRPIKGHRYLIRAFADVLKMIPRAKLVLIGKGGGEGILRSLATDLNIEAQVKFLGYQEDAGRLIGMFDIFALPSLSEGFPNVLLEAMMAHVPVVATRVGGVGEIVTDGQEALLVNPADASGLAAAILRLADQPELRSTLVKNALDRVKNHFDIQKTWAQYDAVYLAIGKKG